MRISLLAAGLTLLGFAAADVSVLRADEAVVVPGIADGPPREVLICWPIPESGRTTSWSVFAEGGQIPSQVIEEATRLCWKGKAGRGADEATRFEIRPAKGETAADDSTAERSGEGIELRTRNGSRAVVTYHTQERLPDGVDAVFRRSGHLHPLRSPRGKALTDEFPADHLHQHAIFFAWVNTEFRGKHVDFWNQPAREGTVRHHDVEEVWSGPLLSGFRASLEHVAFPGGETVALNERWTVQGGRLGRFHLVDVDSDQRAATAEPLILKKYHYGGFAIRGSAGWGEPDQGGTGAVFLTSDGKGRIDGNHAHCSWVRVSGKVGGEPCGLLVLSHPDNFRSPQAVRIHPKMPYFVFSPCVDGEFRISRDEPLRSRYRVLAFDGEMTPEECEAAWNDYARPLTAAKAP